MKPLPGMPEISLSMIPGLQEFLDSILKIILRDTMVFPKAVVVPIATAEGEDGEQQELGVRPADLHPDLHSRLVVMDSACRWRSTCPFRSTLNDPVGEYTIYHII